MTIVLNSCKESEYAAQLRGFNVLQKNVGFWYSQVLQWRTPSCLPLFDTRTTKILADNDRISFVHIFKYTIRT